LGILSANWLPVPKIIISSDFSQIIEAFQNLSFIIEMKQRWEEIKKLQKGLITTG